MELKTYLCQLAPNQKVQDQDVEALITKLQATPVSQLSQQREKIENEILDLKNRFVHNQIQNDHTYDKMIQAHSDVFDRNNQIDTLKNSAIDAARNFQLLSQMDIPKKQEVVDLEQLKDVLSIPNILNQMISQNLIPQSLKLILIYEQKCCQTGLLGQITSEVQLLKQKIIRTLYQMLSKSYLTKQTPIVIRLLELSGIKKATVLIKLGDIRERTVRQLAESTVLTTRQVTPFFKPLLDQVIMIFLEFEQLGFEGRYDWLMLRFSEIRKIAKLALNQQSGKDWFDVVMTLDQLVFNFNQQVTSNIPLCIKDIISKFVQSKSYLTVQHMLNLTSDSLTNSNLFPRVELIKVIQDRRQQLSQVLESTCVDQFTQKVIFEFADQVRQTIWVEKQLSQLSGSKDLPDEQDVIGILQKGTHD